MLALIAATAATPPSIGSAHLYSAKFAQMASSDCSGMMMPPGGIEFTLSNSFGVVGPEVLFAHSSLVLLVDGDPVVPGRTLLNLTVQTDQRVTIRAEATAIAPADRFEFHVGTRSFAQAACPATEHCLVPDVSDTIPVGALAAPCGFAPKPVPRLTVDQVAPFHGSLLMNVSDLLVDARCTRGEPCQMIKLTALPNEEDASGFWNATLAVKSVELLTAPDGRAHA